MQHVVAMFGATFLVPLLTGFPPTTTLFFSGVGTILFLLITAQPAAELPRLVLRLHRPDHAPPAPRRARAARCSASSPSGCCSPLVGAVVTFTGTGWIDALMPPVVAGAIVALIGLNLAPAATANFDKAPLGRADHPGGRDAAGRVAFRGLLARLSIFFGVVVGYVAAVRRRRRWTSPPSRDAAWVGLPDFTSPTVAWSVLPAFLPGRAGAGRRERRPRAQRRPPRRPESLNRLTGRALLADGLATTLAGIGGGSGTTTYGENIGVMAATQVYSTAAYWVAGTFAVAARLLAQGRRAGQHDPAGVLGGVTTALYGLIGVIGVKIWIDNQVDFSRPVNQFTAATALVVGIADYTFTSGSADLQRDRARHRRRDRGLPRDVGGRAARALLTGGWRRDATQMCSRMCQSDDRTVASAGRTRLVAGTTADHAQARRTRAGAARRGAAARRAGEVVELGAAGEAVGQHDGVGARTAYGGQQVVLGDRRRETS